MTYLERAIADGHATLSGVGKKEKITYLAVNHAERFADPEEKVRAEFWAELVYRYGYEPRRVGVEVPVPDRRPEDTADLVVFHDDDRKRPYAVIECKRDGITDAEFDQAVEQACGNGTWAKLRAAYVGVVAGRTRRVLDCSPKYGVLEREANIVADLPKQYGRPEEWRFYKGDPNNDIQAVTKDELIAALDKCHQTLWAGGRRKPDVAFGELCKVVFVKITDEIKPRRKGEPYEFQIKTHESAPRLAQRIRGLYDAQKAKDPNVFTETIKVDDAELRTVVSHLESINLNETELDTKGVAFEVFMQDYFTGDAGQFFTPREIVHFAVEMLRPPDQRWNDLLVLDPACGSGGFLLYALDAVRREASEYNRPGSERHYRHWHDFAQNNLYGIEINEDIARVAKMNMIIHDDGHANVVGADALDRPDAIRRRTGNSGFAEGRFDLILTNPPFGSQISGAERPYLGDYDLGRQEDTKGNVKPRKNQKSEILFIEQIWRFLKPGTGRAAMVLPDGILTNSSLQYVRNFLLERFQLLAVVSLPPTAFAHYGAGVKASLLFLRRRADGEKPRGDEAIFMAAPEKIGYDATGRECRNDLDEVLKNYPDFELKRSAQSNKTCYRVKLKDARVGRIDPHYHNPGFKPLLQAMGNSKYECRLLGDLVDDMSGGATPRLADASQYSHAGVRFLRIQNITPFGLDLADTKYITREVHNGELKRSQLQAGDVLITITGRIGTAAVVKQNHLPANINQHIVRLRLKTKTLSPEFLAYFLNSDIGIMLSNRGVTGTTRIALDYDAVRQIPIPLPPVDVQQALVATVVHQRETARQLRAEATALWEQAKADFQKALLGDSGMGKA